MPRTATLPAKSRARDLRVGPREVRLAARNWVRALALRPLVWSSPFVVLGCVLGRALADFARAESPDEIPLFAPAMLAILCAAACKYLRGAWPRIPLLALCLLGLATAHSARRWTPQRDDISRVVAAHQSRLRPLEPVQGRVVARVAELRRGEFHDSAVLELSPTNATSANLRGARGRVWARLPHAKPGQSAPQVLEGGWIRARINLREARPPGSGAEEDARAFALVRGCWAEGEVERVDASVPSHANWAQGNFSGVIDAARAKIAERFSTGFARLGVPFSQQSAQVATAMAFGEGGLREPLPSALREAFKRAGVSHVLVASGSQVAVVCVLLWGLARLLCAPVKRPSWRAAILAAAIVPALIFYALLVGGAASIWRAALVGLGALWVRARGRRLDALSLWCGALSLLLACDPASLYDLSLQLSFGAAWGLIAFAQPFQSAFLLPFHALRPATRESKTLGAASTWGGILAGAAWWLCRASVGVASVSLAAHVGTLAVLLHAFGTLSVASLCANLPIVPLSSVLVLSGTASLVAPIRALDWLNYTLADGSVRVAGAAASWCSSWIEAPALSLPWTLALGALALVAAGAAAWPALLFAHAPRPEDPGATEDDAPQRPTPHESSLLWRDTFLGAREALGAAIPSEKLR